MKKVGGAIKSPFTKRIVGGKKMGGKRGAC